MAGCLKISTFYAMIRVQHSHSCKLNMGTASGATLIRAGHHLNIASGRVTQALFFSILLDVHPSHAKNTHRLSIVGKVRDHALESMSY
jgi:hypothetical protein